MQRRKRPGIVVTVALALTLAAGAACSGSKDGAPRTTADPAASDPVSVGGTAPPAKPSPAADAVSGEPADPALRDGVIVLGGVPLPEGFPPDAAVLTGDPLIDWNRAREDRTRVAWGREHGKLWVLLGVRSDAGKMPRVLGLGKEAGVPILKAALEDGNGAPVALAVFPASEDVWAMRLRLNDQGPGVWLGYVPEEMAKGPAGAASEKNPVKFVQPFLETLGFSSGSSLELGGLGYHEPAGLQTAMVLVKDRGELFTVRLGRKSDADAWFAWSVHLGRAPQLSPVFMED